MDFLVKNIGIIISILGLIYMVYHYIFCFNSNTDDNSYIVYSLIVIALGLFLHQYIAKSNFTNLN